MKTAFRKSFVRDLKRIKNRELWGRIQLTIEHVESADSLDHIADVKKLGGADQAFRIRVGDHRLGIIVTGDCVEFVRCLHRRDLYRFFP